MYILLNKFNVEVVKKIIIYFKKKDNSIFTYSVPKDSNRYLVNRRQNLSTRNWWPSFPPNMNKIKCDINFQFYSECNCGMNIALLNANITLLIENGLIAFVILFHLYFNDRLKHSNSIRHLSWLIVYFKTQQKYIINFIFLVFLIYKTQQMHC